MKFKIAILILLSIATYTVSAQNKIDIVVKDNNTNELLVGVHVTLKGTQNGGSSDVDGKVTLTDIPDGTQHITFSYLGYETETKKYTFPLKSDEPIEVLMEEDSEMLDDLVVTSTRGSRTFKNIPTRVEFISEEELEEKGVMKPGDIRMLLNESTGIITQQTSATSANASIRIQGLDGRYTQILKDGYPVFSGAASGLGLLQTPPLDLKQVEIIKGSTSTLYGGGAIAGLINLVSKTPKKERELTFHLNGTTGKGMDLNSFYSKRNDKVGTTIFAAYNRNWAYDPSDIGFSAIPKFDRFVLNPKLFLYFSENTDFNIGLNAMVEDRMGGDMKYIEGKSDDVHTYFEENKTQRYSTQLEFNHHFFENSRLGVKNSVSYFDRKINVPNYAFSGAQISSFSEVFYNLSYEKTEWITGANLWTDNFKEQKLTDFQVRDYNQTTFGAFAQNNTQVNEWLDIESGLRADYVVNYGLALLPRIATRFKISPKLSTRVSGGFGYKAPTIFTEDSERMQYQNVLPISDKHNKLERSYGANIDFNYVTSFADDNITFSLNQLFFYTYLQNPLELQRTSDNLFQFNNINGYTDSKGSETNAKVGYDDFKLYIGYTYTDARTNDDGNKYRNTLTPKHRINSVLMYEVEDSWKVGLEGYYTSKQRLNDGLMGKQYMIFGLMIEKLWEKFSIYANFENFTDRRQTRFDTIHTGTISNPVFRDIYAPLDGFVMNAGVIIRL